jgi:hypothetical protein
MPAHVRFANFSSRVQFRSGVGFYK